MVELPLVTISWHIVRKGVTWLIKSARIDIIPDKTSNPSITVAYDTAYVRYRLIARTHGWPKIQPNVIFYNVKGLGEVVRKTVSPSVLGEVDGSFRLKLYKNEMPRTVILL